MVVLDMYPPLTFLPFLSLFLTPVTSGNPLYTHSNGVEQ